MNVSFQGALAGLDSVICGLWTHSLLFRGGPGVFNRQWYGHKSLLSDKRKSKPSVTARQRAQFKKRKKSVCCTHSGMLSHTYQWPRTSSSLLIFLSRSRLSVAVNARTFTFCWPWESSCVCAFTPAFRLHVCVFSTSSALMRQVTVWVWAMEQSVSRLTDYRLALHDNMVGRTLVNRTKGGRDNGRREVKGTNAAFKKLAGNSLTSLGFRGASISTSFWTGHAPAGIWHIYIWLISCQTISTNSC